MLDMKWIRENDEQVQKVANQKGIEVSVSELLEWDEKKRRLLQEAEALRAARNKLSYHIGTLVKQGAYDEAEQAKQRVKETNDRLTAVETELATANRHTAELLALVPNIVSPDTPDGRSDADNVELRRISEAPSFAFEEKDHMALGELHDMIDVRRGVKAAGSRSYFLKGAGVLLHRAVQQLAIDLLLRKGFTLLDVPLMVRTDAMSNTGFFPLGEDQTYRLTDEDKWLVGTSEVPMITFYANEIVNADAPIKLAAASVCFRSEVGSAGRDVHGLYRVHQFAKVEQVILCQADPELSEALLQEITSNAEELLQCLELPYRVMAVCTGDMSQKTYKQYDIETWMPSRRAYGETHSSSNLHDFQARRSHIRYRAGDGALRFCHTLNNTAVASPRILIPLLENHQEEDGSIRLPAALQPYMNGLKRLTPGR